MKVSIASNLSLVERNTRGQISNPCDIVDHQLEQNDGFFKGRVGTSHPTSMDCIENGFVIRVI